MAKTIQAALMPLLFIGAFCSLCVFEFPLGRPRPYFTCLYFLILWSTHFGVFCYLTIVGELVIPENNIIIIIMSLFVSMITNLFRFKELKICLRELSIVDDTLEALGTPKEYKQLYKWVIGVIITWIVLSWFLNTLDVLWEGTKSNFNITRIYVLLMQNLLLHIDTINGVILGTVLGYMGSRFKRVNKHVRNLLENDVKHTGKRNMLILVTREKFLEAGECKRRVWILMHVHLQLSILSRELNKVFSVQLTLEMASLFTILVKLCFEFHNVYVNKNMDTLQQVVANLSIYVWTIMFTTKLFVLNHICQTVCDKANETIAILYKLSNDDIGKDLYEEILQFILQIKQRKVRFSGMGLFYFGNNFIRKFLTSMVTVLIIIIQMRESKSHTDDGTIASTNNKD